MPCGMRTAKCGDKELAFFQNWMSILKGSKENVLKIMIIFSKLVYISNNLLYILVLLPETLLKDPNEHILGPRN